MYKLCIYIYIYIFILLYNIYIIIFIFICLCGDVFIYLLEHIYICVFSVCIYTCKYLHVKSICFRCLYTHRYCSMLYIDFDSTLFYIIFTLIA